MSSETVHHAAENLYKNLDQYVSKKLVKFFQFLYASSPSYSKVQKTFNSLLAFDMHPGFKLAIILTAVAALSYYYISNLEINFIENPVDSQKEYFQFWALTLAFISFLPFLGVIFQNALLFLVANDKGYVQHLIDNAHFAF
eukprot:gene92-829_t